MKKLMKKPEDSAVIEGCFDAVEELPVAYVEMDARGAITRANRLTRQLHSSHAGKLIGKLVWELMPSEEQELSRAFIMKAMESGADPPMTRRSIYTSSNNFRVYEVHHRLIRNSEGRPTGMCAASVDVSEAHKAQQEAERERAWLESVLESMADAVIVTDALGFIRTVNPAAEELFGWKAGELIGKEIEKAFSLLSFVSGSETQAEFILGLEERARGVATMLDREGRELLVEIGSSPIVDKTTGFTRGVVSVLRRVEETSANKP
jgi:PAS domain S-box-containing protein